MQHLIWGMFTSRVTSRALAGLPGRASLRPAIPAVPRSALPGARVIGASSPMSTSPDQHPRPPPPDPASALKRNLAWAFYKTLGFVLSMPPGLSLAWKMLLNPGKALKGTSWSPDTQLQDLLPGLMHEWVTVDGIKLHLVRTCANPDGAKPVVLLLHGFPEGWFSWRQQIEALREEGWCVVAMDMRGYGDSDKPQDVASYRIQRLAADVAAVIRAIAPPSTGRVALCGHDWGGIIAWHVAALYPDLLGRLVVLCAPHPACYTANLDWDQMMRSWYVAAFQTPWIPEAVLRWDGCAMVGSMLSEEKSGGCRNPAALSKEDVAWYRQAFARPGVATAALNYYRAAVDYGIRVGNPDVERALQGKLPMPTLVLWADHDIALGTQLLRGLEQYVEKLRVQVLPDSSHWLQQDRWEEVNQLLLGFLREKDS